MPRSPDALVKGEMLIWARNSAGLDLESAAKKAQVAAQRLQSWENGDRRPTIKQLRKLGKVYKRPIAVFYLAEPPARFQTLRDFRRLPGLEVTTESPDLRLQIRRAQDRRELALELYRVIEGEPPAISLSLQLAEDPEDAAIKVRQLLEIAVEEQVRWERGYEALNHWRAALERVGVLVFQATDVEVSEMRGFSIHADALAAIVLNIKDSPSGRIFTMLHELAHVLLRLGGLCNFRPGDTASPTNEEQRVEVFCNAVAGATLIPSGSLLAEAEVVSNRRDTDWTDAQIRHLADRYGASQEVVLRRLLVLERIPAAFYESKVAEIRQRYPDQPTATTRKGFAPPHRVALSTAGPLFVRLVLNSYYTQQITVGDVSDFLGIRLKHLSKIESEVIKHAS